MQRVRLHAEPTWSLQFQGPIEVRAKTYHVVDLFDVTDEDLARLRAAGSKALAYFSSQYEGWREDMRDVPHGKPLGDWEDEYYLDPRSARIREILRARIVRAKARGFHGIDVDNVDFFGQDTGFDNSQDAAVDLIRFLATTAHEHGLVYSLKNSVELIPRVRDVVDLYQNEQCHETGECAAYDGVGPVFNIEYVRPAKLHERPGFYTILKRRKAMDAWEEVLTP